MTEIKKVVQRIYEFDLSNCELEDGNEMINTDHGNEFVNTFVLRDMDKGIIVTPSGYSKGLMYKSTNNGEFYNPTDWLPDLVDFSLNIYGLKKNAFYRVTVVGRNVRKYNRLIDVTDNRKLEVTDDSQVLLINADLSDSMTNTEFSGIFRATSVEHNLYFSLGKIYINNIIIDEVELVKDTIEEEVVSNDVELDSGKSNIVAYGVFSPKTLNESNSRYSELERITGKGLSLFYDKTDNKYILERDNIEDTVRASFTNANYLIDINFNKAPYASYIITDISADISANTLKQGYIKFQIFDSGEAVKYDRANGRFTFIITKIL